MATGHTLGPLTTLSANAASVLQECAARLAELSATRLEYLLLVLHTLQEV
jgi:hypothetical protein